MEKSPTKLNKLQKARIISKRRGFNPPGLLILLFFLTSVKGQSLNFLVEKKLYSSYFCCKNMDFETPSWKFGQRLCLHSCYLARMRSQYSDTFFYGH